jgi:hypothetical protein
VIALEPNSENCRLLLSSLRRSGLGNVQVLPVAADVQTGWAYYSTHVGSNGGLIDDGDLLTRPGVVVPTFRLDDLVAGPVGLLKTAGPVGLLKTAGPVGLLKTAGPVGLLKMDVEGAEGRVVRGATRLIERDRPIVTTELKEEMLTRVSNTRVGEYLSYFEDLGYTAALLEKETGAEKRYASVADLLADWGGRDELRDVLLLPATR